MPSKCKITRKSALKIIDRAQKCPFPKSAPCPLSILAKTLISMDWLWHNKRICMSRKAEIFDNPPPWTGVHRCLCNNWVQLERCEWVVLQSSKRLFVNSTVATPKYSKVSELRYQMFRSRRGEMESAQLAPCEDTLKQHTRWENYQAAIWRRSLVNSPETSNPSQRYGWTTIEDGSLVINWMPGSQAPQVVLSLLSCKCAPACRPNDCTCIVIGLKCTAACKWQICANMAGDDDEPENDQQDSSDSEDEWKDWNATGKKIHSCLTTCLHVFASIIIYCYFNMSPPSWTIIFLYVKFYVS